jgi:hypothetical protein
MPNNISKRLVQASLCTLVLIASAQAQTSKPGINAAGGVQATAAQNELKERELVEQRARDYAAGKIVCTNAKPRNFMNRDRYAEVGTDMWMLSDNCEYRK